MRPYDSETAKGFLGKRVLITVDGGALYEGVLNGVRKDKLHLSSLLLRNKDGSFKVASKTDTGRWLRLVRVASIALTKEDQ